jgi:hypothetical protein
VNWSRGLIALGVVLMIAACQRAPTTRPAVSESAPTVSELDAAKQALAVANWASATPHLRAALRQDPDSLFLHFSLATCASWLDLTDEADHEFQWVRDHAPSDSEEATAARRWLATRENSTGPHGGADPRFVGDSGVHGIVTWGNPPEPQHRMQLFLMGLPNTPTKDGRYAIRTDENGAYAFRQIPAGTYKLEVLLMMKPRWRMKLALEPGQDLVLDLTPDNSVSRRDDFALAQ